MMRSLVQRAVSLPRDGTRGWHRSMLKHVLDSARLPEQVQLRNFHCVDFDFPCDYKRDPCAKIITIDDQVKKGGRLYLRLVQTPNPSILGSGT